MHKIMCRGFIAFWLSSSAVNAQDPILQATNKPVDYILENFQGYVKTQKYISSICIGAPEIFRYTYFRDFLETTSLELIYIQQGSERVDFSIGPFQMKPSFIEQLEKKIKYFDKAGDFCFLSEYSKGSQEDIRRERLRRMQKSECQLLYLLAFRAYCLDHYNDYLCGLAEDEQLAFMATVYNLGFDKDVATVLAYLKEQNFPYGRGYEGQQHAYGQLAVNIYNQIKTVLCE